VIPADRSPVVVELGPGTGSFNRALQAQQRPPIRHLGIELNPVMSSLLAADYPNIEVITAGAADLTEMLAQEQLLGEVDLIVSGLPWQAFAGPVGSGLIPAIAGALRPDGVFTQFTYSWIRWTPPGRRQHRNLQARFTCGVRSGPIFRRPPSSRAANR
jgi:phospholipid N-methyltransferase